MLVPRTVSKRTPFTRRLAKFSLPLGQGIIGKAAESGTVVLANNAQMDPRSRFQEGLKPEIEHLFAVPPKGKSVLYGVFVVARNGDSGFIEDDVQPVEMLVNAATAAFECGHID